LLPPGFSIFKPSYDPTKILSQIDAIRTGFGNVNDKIIWYYYEKNHGAPRERLHELEQEIITDWTSTRSMLIDGSFAQNMVLMKEGTV
jgi:hypothetical protein